MDSGFVRVDAESYTGVVNESQLIIHKADEIHSLTCPDDEASNVIIIGFECLCDELDVFSKKPATLNDAEKRLLTEIILEGRSVFLPPYDVPNQKDMKKRSDYPFGADQMIKIKMENLLIELVRGIGSCEEHSTGEISYEKVQEIVRYINENLEKINIPNSVISIEKSNFPIGEKYFKALIEDLKKAKKYILMEYFILAKGKLWQDIEDILREKAKEEGRRIQEF